MSPIPFGKIIETVAGIASPIVKDKFQRNQVVIKLLKQFNLEPEHPPADFSGVYAYALVEYGIGKPKAFLQLFEQEIIKRAFRKAFDHNNPSILLSEVDDFVEAYALGDEVKSLGIDIKREIAAFYIVFAEVAKRTRNPADILMGQQIATLHKRIVAIQDNLDRLPTLEGIRTEMARLAAQDYLALPSAKTSSENQCRAIALAQEMRGWFETLGYRFEKYEVWAENFFEWIINIPVRRNRYDRILVRGIEGEAGLGDVMALRQSVEQQRADEGWLVTTRRIARVARNEVEKEENDFLGCYTFDELLLQDADFSGYLDWLEVEIKRRKIDQKYVPLACSKEEIDPDTKQQIAVSHYGEEDGWIEGYIDRWLDDSAKEHISILGEFGTGKTWFALHYAWVALQRYRDAQKRGVQLPRLPLVIPLRDYAKAVSVESLFSEFFFRQYKIPIPHYDAFVQLNRMGKLLLIFDGFDEMAARVNRQEMINNFWELAKVVVPGAKVILTCRTEHFPEAKERRALLNAELQASTANLTGETPQFEVLELEKFNDEQIKQVLSFQAEPTTVEEVMSNPQLLDLARRPVMTDLILEALPDIEAGKPVDMSRVYLYAVRQKMDRDIKAERTFTSLADKLYFLCELSWEMLSTEQLSFNYRLFPDRIRRLFGSVVQEEKDLDHWHYDMMGQTMLIRDADGDYTPAHRSLLEFFVAYKFAAELGVLADDFTELAQAHSHLDTRATPQDYTWSAYFRRQVDAAGEIVLIAPLKGFVNESLTVLRSSFGKAPLTKAVMDLMRGIVGDRYSLVDAIEATRGRSEDEVGYVGGNAATLALQVDKGALEGRDFSGAVIKGADFSGASLRDVNFAGANLADCIFTKVLGGVWSMAFSPDGRLFATGDSNGVVSLWDTTARRKILTFKGHTSWVRSVVFSPDGATLASGSEDQTVRLWNIRSGECLHTLHRHTSWVNSVAFSPDGQIIASGSSDQTVRLWNISSGECLHTLQGHTHWVYSVAFSPNGQIIASGSYDQTVRLWNINSGKCFCTLQGHTNWVRSVAFSPDGKTLASGSADQTVRLWNINSGKCFCTLQEHTNWVYSVAFSPDGKTLASGSADQTVRLWNINSGKCFCTLQ
ncbi:MAG: NACHT domain-containing protein, partial [Cyanobacteria bacterium P01_D01_bin.116]